MTAARAASIALAFGATAVFAQAPASRAPVPALPTGNAARQDAQGGFTADIGAETNGMIDASNRANRPVKPTAPGAPNADAARAHEQPHR
jgi:hypothetical protein